MLFNLILAEYHLQNDADDKPPKTQTAKSRKQPVADEDAEAGPSKTDPTSSVPSSSTRVAANDPDDSDKADQASSRTVLISTLLTLLVTEERIRAVCPDRRSSKTPESQEKERDEGKRDFLHMHPHSRPRIIRMNQKRVSTSIRLRNHTHPNHYI